MKRVNVPRTPPLLTPLFGRLVAGTSSAAIACLLFTQCTDTSSNKKAVRISSKYDEYKSQIRSHADALSKLKADRLASEGPLGYLVLDGKVTMDQRNTVQKENFLRELLFDEIGRHFQKSREEIASSFALMAKSL
jgi:hypothetical protein